MAVATNMREGTQVHQLTRLRTVFQIYRKMLGLYGLAPEQLTAVGEQWLLAFLDS